MRRWITLWIVPAIAVLASLPQAARADTGATDGGITITIPAPLPTVTPPAPMQPPSADTMEAALLVKLNAERAAARLAPLRSQPWAQTVARAHSNEMAAARNIWHNHTGYLDVARQTVGAYLVGENVAEAGTLDEADGLLMASAPHRANILYPTFDEVGIGVAVDVAGYVYVTQDFLDMRPAAATKPAAAPTKATVPAASSTPPKQPPAPAATPTASAPAVSMTLAAADPQPSPSPTSTASTAPGDPPAGLDTVAPAGSHAQFPTPALPAALGAITAFAAVGVPARLIRRRHRRHLRTTFRRR